MSLSAAQRTEIEKVVESYINKLLKPDVSGSTDSMDRTVIFRAVAAEAARSFALPTSPAQTTDPLAIEPLVRVIARAVEVLGTSEKALRWLNAPVRSLGDRPPVSLLNSPEGIARIEDTLGRIEHGVW
jgi:uncharacterized protein (DUF2384 family)